MSKRITYTIPPGCAPINAIQQVFSYPFESAKLEQAVREYEGLLKSVHQFQVQNIDKYSIIRRKLKGLSINSYTVFGEDLEAKYPESGLIKLINKAYSMYRDHNLRDAMVEFNILKEARHEPQMSVTVGRTQQLVDPKTRVTNFSTTVNPTGRQQSVDSVHSLPQSHGNMKIIEEENTRLKMLVDRQGQDIIGLQKTNKENDRVIDELRNRLSGFASKQLTEGNPNFTDLSDKNRPTRIAENFHAVYDDEWTNALEVLSATRKGNFTEEQAIHKLMNLVKEIYKFCCSTASDQTLNIVMNILKPFTMDTQPGGKDDGKMFRSDLEPKVKLLRREYCMEPIANITEKFKRTSEDFKIMQKYPEVVKYTEKCTELFWLMRTIDPPMVLKWPEGGEVLNVTLYNHYNKKGDKVSFAVWPAVLLHEGGAVMYKGFAKPQ